MRVYNMQRRGGRVCDGPRAVYTTRKRALLRLPTRAAEGVIPPVYAITPHPSCRPPSIAVLLSHPSPPPLYRCLPPLRPRRPSANITHVDTAFFTAAAANRCICMYYIYRHHHSSRARVIWPAQGCHSTCSSLLSNELPYIYISYCAFRCLPTPPSPSTTVKTSTYLCAAVPTYLPYTTISNYTMCRTSVVLFHPVTALKAFSSLSLSPSNYIVLRVHAPYYRINTTATVTLVVVASLRAYMETPSS